jgi:hypothetical protein
MQVALPCYRLDMLHSIKSARLKLRQEKRWHPDVRVVIGGFNDFASYNEALWHDGAVGNPFEQEKGITSLPRTQTGLYVSARHTAYRGSAGKDQWLVLAVLRLKCSWSR